MTSNPPVYFFFNKQFFHLPHRLSLKFFIVSIFKKEKILLEKISYIFCSDKELWKINKKYLKHNFLTDIISFDFSEKKGKKQAEIYISIDRVKENSKTYGVSFNKEIHRVIFHGALHLCGYKDKSRKEKIEMTEKENFYLNRYFMK